MPTAAPKFSLFKTERKPWQGNSDSKRKITGRALQREREMLFKLEPLCRECAKHGRVTIASIRDHIINLAEGGEDTRENTQPLCRPCSDVKTAEEAKRGRGLKV